MDVISRLTEWANQRDDVRAMLLTSTRAQPNADTDALSDYDIVLVVTDIHDFSDSRLWVEDFGEILVTYWDPVYPDHDYGVDQTGNVIQYADGLKIDFRVWPIELLKRIVRAEALPADIDAGYRVLLDKDALTRDMKAPTYRAYIPSRPSEREFQTFVEEFFSDAPYVAKFLLRGDLMPAKWCLDYDMKHVYLRGMLEWRVECEHGWSIPMRNLGKGLKKHLPASIWHELEETYAGAGEAENWEALFRTMALFRWVATEVARNLGYSYPDELDERVTAFVRARRSTSLRSE